MMVTLLHHLDRKCFDVHLGVLDAHGPLLEQLPADIEVHNLKSKRVRHSIGPLLRLIWKLRPDTVLSTLGHLNLALLALRPLLPKGIRLCVRESTIPSASFRVEGQSHAWARLYRGLYPTADTVVCQSDHMKNDLAQTFGVARQDMVRIYNPVDLAHLLRLAEGDSPFLGGGIQLVASGRLEHAKGFDVLLSAVALVRKRIPEVRLTILGEGNLGEALRTQSKSLGLQGTVTFSGFVLNPYPYYAHADLFVLSSRYEGLPNAMLEAMALGAPVIATDCPGGVREVVRHSPVHRLVPVEDPSSLAAGIITMLQERQRPAIEEQRKLQQMLSVTEIVTQYEALLLN